MKVLVFSINNIICTFTGRYSTQRVGLRSRDDARISRHRLEEYKRSRGLPFWSSRAASAYSGDAARAHGGLRSAVSSRSFAASLSRPVSGLPRLNRRCVPVISRNFIVLDSRDRRHLASDRYCWESRTRFSGPVSLVRVTLDSDASLCVGKWKP